MTLKASGGHTLGMRMKWGRCCAVEEIGNMKKMTGKWAVCSVLPGHHTLRWCLVMNSRPDFSGLHDGWDGVVVNAEQVQRINALSSWL